MTTLELSAQHHADKDSKKKFQRRRTNVQQQQNGQSRQHFQRKDIIKQNNPVHLQQNIQVKKKVIVVAPNGQRKFVGQPKVFKPTHNHLIHKFKLKGANQAFVSGRNYSVYHNNYRIRRNGRFYTFVALGALAPLAIAGATYYPYAYLDVPEDYCTGLTEDGCEMVYREVETVEGGEFEQCTAYCPWGGSDQGGSDQERAAIGAAAIGAAAIGAIKNRACPERRRGLVWRRPRPCRRRARRPRRRCRAEHRAAGLDDEALSGFWAPNFRS